MLLRLGQKHKERLAQLNKEKKIMPKEKGSMNNKYLVKGKTLNGKRIGRSPGLLKRKQNIKISNKEAGGKKQKKNDLIFHFHLGRLPCLEDAVERRG